MSHSLTVSFIGICTHLTATHEMKGVEPFEPRTGDGKRVQHRVFLANSDLIESNIDPKRKVARHIAKMQIHRPDGTSSEHVLTNDAIAFEGLDPSKGEPKHYDDLRSLPSMWARGNHPVLQRAVLDGWTPYAAAYVDFTGVRGVKFTVGLREVLAELAFTEEPKLVHRRENSGPGTVYTLPSGTTIEISNVPANPTDCGDSDYLLHYFATNADLLSNAPIWKPEITAEEKIATLQGGGPVGEVYCSNSAYP